VGELTPVKLGSDGVVKLVSVGTTEPPKLLLQAQLELEDRVGIGRLSGRTTRTICLILQAIQADCVTI
jgi:hypothetical protein